MVFRLALKWGWPDPDALADTMTPEQLNQWLAYDIVEPIGNEWEAAGTVAATVANSMSRFMAAKAGRTFGTDDMLAPGDFIARPRWWHDERRGLSDAESEEQMRGLV